MTDRREAYAPHAPLGVRGGGADGADRPVDRCVANIWPERARFRAILGALPPSPDRVLDVGVVRHELGRRGYGNLHAQLHVSLPGAEIVGIDTDAEGVARMRSPGYDVREMDAEDMDLGGVFDAVVAGEVIEHMASPGAFLDSAGDHLADGGSVVLTTPNPDAVRFMRKAINGRWTSEDHTCWVSPQHLERLADRSAHGWGLETVEYLRPPDGLSRRLYDSGRERIGATTYLAVLREGSA